MKYLECVIFNVEHGFCSFIKSPNEYGLLIDCGGRENFSPIKWVKQNYNSGHHNIKYFDKCRIAKCIITHLHADHFSDIDSFRQIKMETPRRLKRDKELLYLIDNKIKDTNHDERKKNILVNFNNFQKIYKIEAKTIIDWGFKIECGQLSKKKAKEISSTDDKYINNRSIITGISYKGKKILFPGDIEVEGWEEVIKSDKLNQILANTNFFITSHHGHKSGFTSGILDYTGKPDLFFVSNKRGDDHFNTTYTISEYSKGMILKGESDISRVVSTRKRNKSIKITIWENGSSTVEYLDMADNLNTDQEKRMSKRRIMTQKRKI